MGNLRSAFRALGRFDRIDFGFLFGGGHARVSRHIAGAEFPSSRRIRACRAVPGRGEFNLSAASVALFHDFTTDTAVVRASRRRHERAILPFSNRCTNQGYHLLIVISRADRLRTKNLSLILEGGSLVNKNRRDRRPDREFSCGRTSPGTPCPLIFDENIDNYGSRSTVTTRFRIRRAVDRMPSSWKASKGKNDHRKG